ncbi:MAG: DUF2283 domain-containing protein, partial [Candidatus Electrothrix sp. MAN1_4]|nr:DUF2283 domain-containing protein [Candidatus Electrothrix sp. MAN1_4]
PNITLELDENREIIGIEILEASKYIRDTILEVAQAKLMNIEHASKPGGQSLHPTC